METKDFKQPDAVIIDDTLFVLQHDYSYEWIIKVDAVRSDAPQHPKQILNRIDIRRGFRWDGASVPRIFWQLGFKPDGKHRAAALIHDLMYIYRGQLPGDLFTARHDNADWHPQSGSFSRKDADRMFGKLMKEAEVKRSYRSIMYWFVRVFGWMYWRDGKDELTLNSLKFIFRLSVLGILVYFLVFHLHWSQS